MKVVKNSNDPESMSSLLEEYMFQKEAHSILKESCSAPDVKGFLIISEDSDLYHKYCRYVMVCEYCSIVPGHHATLSLHSALVQHEAKRPMLTEKEWKDVSMEIMDALNILQESDLYHNDVKSDNILLAFKGEHCASDHYRFWFI